MIGHYLDPGIRGCGVAVFVETNLVAAAYVRNPYEKGNGPGECVAMARAAHEWFVNTLTSKVPARTDTQDRRLVVEWPRVLLASHQSDEKRDVDPNDLLPLVGIDCVLASLMSGVNISRVYPSDWKGTVDKFVMNDRVMNRLTVDEKKLIEKTAKSLMHNVLDAIGIGLHDVGRLERRRVFPR